MSPDPVIINGHGAWRVTLQDGGVTMFECWEIDSDGKVMAYYSAGAPPRESA